VAVSEIDPQTVLTAREIARAHLKVEGATVTPADIVYAVKAYFGDGLDADTLQSWCLALRDELSRANVTAALSLSWPDEQQPAEAMGGEQVQDGATSAPVNRLTAICEYVETYGKWPRTRAAKRDAADLRTVVAERDALAARVAELEGERETDARAVARCQQAKAGPDAVPAMLALDARFADRIEALAGDEMDGGAA